MKIVGLNIDKGRVAASVIGLWVSYFANASSGGTIVLVVTAEFALVWAATQLRR